MSKVFQKYVVNCESFNCEATCECLIPINKVTIHNGSISIPPYLFEKDLIAQQWSFDEFNFIALCPEHKNKE